MIVRMVLLAVLSLWFPTCYKRWTHTFRPEKCLLSWPLNPAWEVQAPREDLLKVLKAPFSYLGKGAQSYVFLSADGEYVLKLFRFDTCQIPFGQKSVRWIRKVLGLSEKHQMALPLKVEKTLTSCYLAYRVAPELTGVVCVHLNLKPIGIEMLHLKDRLGRTHAIDPLRYRFLLQKKGEPLLESILTSKDPISLIGSYLQLLENLSSLGLANLDPTMGKNFGVLDGKAIQIDVGNFTLDLDRAKKDPPYFRDRFFRWLSQKEPELAAAFEKSNEVF